MFIKRNQFVKRKIIGGNLLGNLFNKAKGVLYNTGKLIIPKAKSLGKMAAHKAIKAAKDQVTPEKVFDLAQDLVKKDKKALKRKLKNEVGQVASTLSKDKELDPHLRDVISRLAAAQNEDAKKVLMDKGKELLLANNSRALLSNIIAGSGLKKMCRHEVDLGKKC